MTYLINILVLHWYKKIIFNPRWPSALKPLFSLIILSCHKWFLIVYDHDGRKKCVCACMVLSTPKALYSRKWCEKDQIMKKKHCQDVNHTVFQLRNNVFSNIFNNICSIGPHKVLISFWYWVSFSDAELLLHFKETIKASFALLHIPPLALWGNSTWDEMHYTT